METMQVLQDLDGIWLSFHGKDEMFSAAERLRSHFLRVFFLSFIFLSRNLALNLWQHLGFTRFRLTFRLAIMARICAGLLESLEVQSLAT